MRTIRTTIDIDAEPDVTWQVLTDFDAYARGTPFMPHGAGEASVGTKLTVELAPPGGRRRTFRPTVTAAEPGRLLEWLGRVGAPGVFDGRHRFALEPLPDGTTRFTQSESFSGLLVPLLWRSIVGPTTAGFEQFNDAFADRCRAVSSSPVGRAGVEPETP